ncbi:MAG: hypothetical protein J6B56_04440 [Clostridia bacterium]|nr:hypothetical protein [Clostridia bacterium]
MKKISSYEIALSALACAIATVFLTVGVYSEILLFTGYLLSCVALMLPLAKQSFRGYALAYIATCILALIFNASRFWDLLPFIMFFGLHPLVNELQLKIKINRWLACAIKALWFDFTMYLIWRFVFAMTTTIPLIDQYILPIILVVGSAFFVVYDYLTYKWRAAVNILVQRLNRK